MDEMPFEEQSRRFNERLQATPDYPLYQSYRGLIVLGSGQFITAALWLGSLQIERTAFLLTEETKAKNFCAEVAALLGGEGAGWVTYPLEDLSPLAVYKALKQVWQDWSDFRVPVAVDITGGTKQMSVGLAKAAHVLRLNTIYIESKFAPDASGNSVLVPGTQRPVNVPDVYTVLGDLEAAEAERLYRGHDYAGAARIFADLASRNQIPDQEMYQAYATLAMAYAAWDNLNLADARAQLEKLLASNLPPQITAHQRTLEDQVAALAHLAGSALPTAGRKQSLKEDLRNPKIMLPLLGTLYSNAVRREQSGRYDMAALLVYRCLEAIAQYRLATYGILTEAFDKEKFTEVFDKKKVKKYPNAATAYKNVAQQFNPAKDRGLPGGDVGLIKAYMLLAALDDDVLTKPTPYDITQIESRTEVRNRSILIHGYRLIAQPEYEAFRTVGEELLERFFALPDLAQTREDWETTYRFVKPFAERS